MVAGQDRGAVRSVPRRREGQRILGRCFRLFRRASCLCVSRGLLVASDDACLLYQVGQVDRGLAGRGLAGRSGWFTEPHQPRFAPTSRPTHRWRECRIPPRGRLPPRASPDLSHRDECKGRPGGVLRLGFASALTRRRCTEMMGVRKEGGSLFCIFMVTYRGQLHRHV